MKKILYTPTGEFQKGFYLNEVIKLNNEYVIKLTFLGVQLINFPCDVIKTYLSDNTNNLEILKTK